MHENNFVSGDVEPSVARRNRTPRHSFATSGSVAAMIRTMRWMMVVRGRAAARPSAKRTVAAGHPLGPRRNDKAVTGDRLLRRGYDSWPATPEQAPARLRERRSRTRAARHHAGAARPHAAATTWFSLRAKSLRLKFLTFQILKYLQDCSDEVPVTDRPKTVGAALEVAFQSFFNNFIENV